jgi:hypothetical protein
MVLLSALLRCLQWHARSHVVRLQLILLCLAHCWLSHCCCYCDVLLGAAVIGMLTMDRVVLSNIVASVRAGDKGNQWPERIPVNDHAKMDTWLNVMMGECQHCYST